MPVQLDQIVPWGRSFHEYVWMFALSEEDLRGSIIDCAAGPSSVSNLARGCRHPPKKVASVHWPSSLW